MAGPTVTCAVCAVDVALVDGVGECDCGGRTARCRCGHAWRIRHVRRGRPAAEPRCGACRRTNRRALLTAEKRRQRAALSAPRPTEFATATAAPAQTGRTGGSGPVSGPIHGTDRPTDRSEAA